MADPNCLLAASIREMMHEKPRISPDCFIFRTPEIFRDSKEELFDPKVVSIGPLHHGKKGLQAMEKRKLYYLEAFLARTSVSVETFVKKIREWEDDIRDCYEETIQLTSDDFVKMALFDGCFVVQIIVRYYNRERDHLSHARFDFWNDIILVENQLPFFLLQGLYNLAFPHTMGTDECFLNLCLHFIKLFQVWWQIGITVEDLSQQQQSEIKHLLDLLRTCVAPSIPRESPQDFPVEIAMPKATQLEEAGMLIMPHMDCKSGLDIRYTPGVLEIPRFTMSEKADFVLINLIAFEFFLYPQDSYISDYIKFMNTLIDTSKDVDLLIRNGIIETGSASDSQRVATLINNLRRKFLARNYFYYGIQEKVKAYYKVPWHRWKASLRRDYFGSPWIIASTTAALILLILTLIQTICSIMSVT